MVVIHISIELLKARSGVQTHCLQVLWPMTSLLCQRDVNDFDSSVEWSVCRNLNDCDSLIV